MRVRAKVTVFVEDSRRKAGAVFDYNGKKSPHLEPLDGPWPENSEEQAAASEAPEGGEQDGTMTRNQIMKRLDGLGVGYGANDNKATLTTLLNETMQKVAPAASEAPEKSETTE